MKLYIVKGYRIKKRNNNLHKRVDSFVGYFTNLKEVYSYFETATVSSYSTVAKAIKRKGSFQVFNSKFLFKNKTKKFEEINIYRVETNELYEHLQFINFQKQIKEEISEFNFTKKLLQ